jgi:hypothetical protein
MVFFVTRYVNDFMGAKQGKHALRAGKHAKYNKLQLFASDLLNALSDTGRRLDDVAFNVILVATGARTATLLERSDYYPNEEVFDAVVSALQRVVPRHTSRIGMRMRDDENLQFLVYNRTLDPALVDKAMTDTKAMGQVLGFQCAGDEAAPYFVRFTLYSRGRKKEFYTETCAEQPDADTVRRQLDTFRNVARQIGWDVKAQIKKAMHKHEIVALLRSGDREAIRRHETDIRQQLLNDMLYTLGEADELDWDMTAAALLNATEELNVVLEFRPLSAEEWNATTEVSDRGEALLLPSRVAAWQPVKQLNTFDDVLAAIANQQFSLLNSSSGQRNLGDLFDSTCAPDALSVVGLTPSARRWTVVYVFIALRILHNPASAMEVKDPFCMQALELMLRGV